MVLILATVGLLKADRHADRRGHVAAWLSLLLGIAVSLAANIAAAPALDWQPILVAGWPPVALLLAVELVAHRSRPRDHTETNSDGPTNISHDEIADEGPANGGESDDVVTLAEVSPTSPSSAEPTAPRTSCGHTSSENKRAAASPPAPNWTG